MEPKVLKFEFRFPGSNNIAGVVTVINGKARLSRNLKKLPADVQSIIKKVCESSYASVYETVKDINP